MRLAAALAFLLVAGRAAAALPAVSTATAAAPAPAPKPRVLPGVPIELKAADGWTIKGKFMAPRSSDTYTFVLLHGTGQKKELWYFLTRYLTRAGYGWLALDLRGHGESVNGPDGQPRSWRKFKATKGENDYAAIALDIQAAVAFLTANGLAEETIGLIGTDVGGSVALKYAAVHPKAPLLALFSPGMSYQEITTVNAIRAYKNRPILLVYSELDKNSSKATPILYMFARGAAGERNATVVSVARLHGVKLPINGPTLRRVVAWIKDPVKPETPTEGLSVDGSSGTIDEGLGPEEPMPGGETGGQSPQPGSDGWIQ